MFRPAVDERQARQRALKHLVARLFNGSPSLLVLNVLEDEAIDARNSGGSRSSFETPEGAQHVDFVANWLVQGCVVALATVVIVRVATRTGSLRATSCAGCFSLFSAAAGVTDSRCAVAGARRHGRYDRVCGSGLASHSPSLPADHRRVARVGGVFGGQLAHAMVAIRRARQRFRAFPLVLERRLRNWTRVKHQGRRRRWFSRTT